MTFFEYAEFSRSVEFKDELEWRRWSQLLSLTYNINRGKGKSMSPDDFNPYEMMCKQTHTEEMDKDGIEALKAEILSRKTKPKQQNG